MTGKPVRARMRDSALQVIRFTGALDATSRSRWRSSRLLILCYHGFAQDDEHLWNSSMYVTRGHLEARLAFLVAEGYVVLPLSEGLARLAAGTLPSRAVVITIDDGTYDFYAVAYPVFKRLGIPVTLYVSTYYVLDGRPVFDGACQYLLWKAWTLARGDLKDPLQEDGSPLRTAAECGKEEISSFVRSRIIGALWRAAEWIRRGSPTSAIPVAFTAPACSPGSRKLALPRR